MVQSQIKNNKFYFYIYYDPVTSVPFLVGKGHNIRAWDHLNENKNSYLKNKIKSLKNKPIIRLFPVSSEKEAFLCEELLIKHFGRKGIDPNGILTNRIFGGLGGWKGIPKTKEHRRKISLANKLFYKINKHWITGTKRPFHSKLMKERYKNGNHTFRNMDFSGKNNPNAKKFILISPNGNRYKIVGGFKKFCNQNNLSLATFKKTIRTGINPMGGKNLNWRIVKYEN